MKNYKSYEELVKVSNEDLLDEWDRNMDIYMNCEPVKRNKTRKPEKEDTPDDI